jgi:hypothetical protein
MGDDRIQWPGEVTFPDPGDGLGQPTHPMSEASFGQPGELLFLMTLFLSSQKGSSVFPKLFSSIQN